MGRIERKEKVMSNNQSNMPFSQLLLNSQDPIAMFLFGDVGAGKTSLIADLEKVLEEVNRKNFDWVISTFGAPLTIEVYDPDPEGVEGLHPTEMVKPLMDAEVVNFFRDLKKKDERHVIRVFADAGPDRSQRHTLMTAVKETFGYRVILVCLKVSLVDSVLGNESRPRQMGDDVVMSVHAELPDTWEDLKNKGDCFLEYTVDHRTDHEKVVEDETKRAALDLIQSVQERVQEALAQDDVLRLIDPYNELHEMRIGHLMTTWDDADVLAALEQLQQTSQLVWEALAKQSQPDFVREMLNGAKVCREVTQACQKAIQRVTRSLQELEDLEQQKNWANSTVTEGQYQEAVDRVQRDIDEATETGKNARFVGLTIQTMRKTKEDRIGNWVYGETLKVWYDDEVTRKLAFAVHLAVYDTVAYTDDWCKKALEASEEVARAIKRKSEMLRLLLR
jgi:hypothetical protein